jgi:hypothetical protein
MDTKPQIKYPQITQISVGGSGYMALTVEAVERDNFSSWKVSSPAASMDRETEIWRNLCNLRIFTFS